MSSLVTGSELHIAMPITLSESSNRNDFPRSRPQTHAGGKEGNGRKQRRFDKEKKGGRKLRVSARGPCSMTQKHRIWWSDLVQNSVTTNTFMRPCQLRLHPLKMTSPYKGGFPRHVLTVGGHTLNRLLEGNENHYRLLHEDWTANLLHSTWKYSYKWC
jgi:hypothetical protein